MGTFTLKFTGELKMLSLLSALLLFLEKWGTLGAKPQLGYGVFAIENRDEVLTWAQGGGKNKPGWRWEILGNRKPDKKLPNLKSFRFFKFRFSPKQPGWWTQIPGLRRVSTQVQPLIIKYQVAPVSPALKNEWRFNRWDSKWGNDWEIFGTLRPDRIRSRVTVSWAYRANGAWEVRGWAWLQSCRWADKLWSILENEQVWRNVLKVHGQVSACLLTSKQDV